VLGREVKKLTLQKQSRKRPTLVNFDPNEFIRDPIMVKAIKGMANSVTSANVID
jgi:hypothetical protein